MKRVKERLNCPNPLFERWLLEWRDEAIAKGSDMQYCFSKALATLRKYPLPLETGKDCIILQNFGSNLCTLLDKKLAEHQRGTPQLQVTLTKQKEAGGTIEYILGDQDINVKNTEGKKVTKSIYEKTGHFVSVPTTELYVPSWRSGGYAILIALFNKSRDPNYSGYLTKAELQIEAQAYCDHSFTVCKPSTRCSAWSSMSLLISKGLVLKRNRPPKYSLTNEGVTLATKLSQMNKNDLNLKHHFPHRGDIELSSEVTQRGNSDAQKVLHGTKSVRKREENEVIDFEVHQEHTQIGNVIKSNYDKMKQSHAMGTISKKTPINVDTQLKSLVNVTEPGVSFAPHTFNVVLLVDTRETDGGKTRPTHDVTLIELTQTKVLFEVRSLKIGDFAWIAKSKDTGEELVLPYIVERKRIDDLGASIKDGRFHEQKFRLKQSGIKNIIYMIESYGNNQYTGLPISSILQASINSSVQDGFTVKYTDSHRESMQYLAMVTKLLTEKFQKIHLEECKKNYPVTTNVDNYKIYLVAFKDFNKSSSKLKNFKVKQMFIRQLLQLKGVSVEKALAIVDKYTTPKLLVTALTNAGPEGEKLLANIKAGSLKRQLGHALSKTIYQFYTRRLLE
ncbi:crossover junction endonuclease MUS81 isoform X2 [Orussus abietinus]|uniref:crossover junction endonuclease MUS81 isoform X2 n=1 Tax=Orussus abietinus TaxID=222816 RepID=UPI0006256CBD|nr:crossover junction endonuclease MUS81 isoform X2 [Orussus abietinus]